MEVPKTLIVKYEPNEIVNQLLTDFHEMVNYAIKQGLAYGYSVKKLHKLCYDVFKQRYPQYYVMYYPMAYRIAGSIIRSWKSREGKTPEMRKRIVRVHKTLFKLDVENSRLLLKVRKGEELNIPLKLSKWHKQELTRGRNGEILVNESHVYIPIKIRVEEISPAQYVAIDVNENNLAYASSDGKSGKIVTGLKELKVAYANKRKHIQKKLSKNSKLFKRLMVKYRKRERNRAKDILHKVSRLVADSFKGYGIILENLKHLRNSPNRRIKHYNRFSGKVQLVSVKNKFMKFRLNAFPFRRIQSYIDYKAKLNGSPVHHLNPKGTSKYCFKCGGLINSLRKCPNCGMDRDFNACLNLLKMWGYSPLPESFPMSTMKLPLTSGLMLSHDEDKAVEIREELRGRCR